MTEPKNGITEVHLTVEIIQKGKKKEWEMEAHATIIFQENNIKNPGRNHMFNTITLVEYLKDW